MSPAKFDSFLTSNDVAHEAPCPRLTVPERWCWIAGIKALASKSPMRGALLIAVGEPATADDVRRQADVPVKVAKATMDKLVRLGVLEHDDDLGCLIVVSWHEEQREPRPSDSREAWAERKRQQRAREAMSRPDVPRDSHTPSHADVTPNGHAHPFAPAIARREEK